LVFLALCRITPLAQGDISAGENYFFGATAGTTGVMLFLAAGLATFEATAFLCL